MIESAILFFFFQAEDGIRDRDVTGVQTCALPISTGRGRSPCPANSASRRMTRSGSSSSTSLDSRSEERRVGKECRSRWPPFLEKNQWTSRSHDQGQYEGEAQERDAYTSHRRTNDS